MDKLEQYLDQVCRSIGGPAQMRAHVRQELREHLLDAVAGHRATGMTEADALARALEEFGKVDEVRSELEATYGQRRMLAMVIDKALDWKEKTMRAKWLWMTWVYATLILVVALGALWILFANVSLVPRFKLLMRVGIIDPSIVDEPTPAWLVSFVDQVSHVGGHYTTWILLAIVVAVGLFEWRVKSENKSWIRLAALGTAAVLLTVVSVLLAGAMIIAFLLGAPPVGRMVRPFVEQQLAVIDTSVRGMEEALAKKDWKAMPAHAERASQGLAELARPGPVVPALAGTGPGLTIDEQNARVAELRSNLREANDRLQDVQQAIQAEDAARLETALAKFRKTYEPVRAATKRPPAPGRGE
jgi:hypothetical protein